MAQQKKGRLTTVLLLLCILLGMGLILYPSVSNYINEKNSTKAMAAYREQIVRLPDLRIRRMMEEAADYNKDLTERGVKLKLNEEERSRYEAVLDPGGTGMMASVEIPTLGVYLPIYHGTEDEVLGQAVGHLEWSALPVGGEGTHCVISGHRGLPSARLFTDLDKMAVGDVFYLHTLNTTLIYEVEQTIIVEPGDTAMLMPVSGRDLCTLVTCTPYSVNSHRLLIRGHRIEKEGMGNEIYVHNDGFMMDPTILAPIIAVPLYLLVMLGILLRRPKKKQSEKNRVNRR